MSKKISNSQTMLLKQLAKEIRYRRKLEYYTQGDLAYKAGVSNATISKIERIGINTKKSSVLFCNIVKVARVLKIKVQIQL